MTMRRPRSGERHRQPPELRRERNERAEELELPRVDDGDVHGGPHDLSVQRRGDLLRDHDSCPVLRLGGRSGEVRRDDDLRQLEERARVRLRTEHVEGGAGHLAGPNGRDERLLVDQVAPRRVDDANAVLHPLERRGVEQPLRLVVEREVERDDVGLRVDLLERRSRLDPELAEPVGRDEGVVRHHAHPESERAVRDLASDPSQAEHAQRLPRELDAGEALPVPDPRRERGVRLRHVAREREQERDRVLGGGVDRRLGGIRDHDAATGRRVDVDVVHPHAGAPDDLEPHGAFDERGVERRRRAHDDRVEVADDRGQIGLGVLDHLEPPSQELETGVRDSLADEDALARLRHVRRRGTPRARAPWRRRARSVRHAPRGAARPLSARS